MKRRLLATLILVGVSATLASAAGTAEAKAPIGTCRTGTEPAPITEFPASLAFVDHNGNGIVCVFQVPATGTPGSANIITDDIAMAKA